MDSESVSALAGRQYGLFTRAQALALGLTARQIDHGAVTGRWDRLHRGVFRLAGVPETDHQRLMAAVLAAGGGAMASHRAAAWAWGLSEKLTLDVMGPNRRRLGPGITFHRLGEPLRPVVRHKIPCTNPLRTITDLAGLGDKPLLTRALDRGVASGLVNTEAVAAELDRRAGKGVAGVELLRECLGERLDKGSPQRTSVLESEMDRLILRFDLPLPERQYWVPGTRYRLDYAYPLLKLCIEVDGYADRAGLGPFRGDRRRQTALILLGWTVLRFTWYEVRHQPAWVAAAIMQALSGQPSPV